jgi:hypothetical protein
MQVRVEVRDAQGNPASGHDVRVSLLGEPREARGTEPGVYLATLPTRRQAGTVELPVAVVPRTDTCPRPWAALAPDGTVRVRDVRGILCRLEFQVLGAAGDVVFEGSTESDGRLKLPAAHPPWNSRLVAKRASGGAADVLWMGREEVIAPVAIVHHTATASWRLPSPVDLKLKVLSRGADSVTLALYLSGLTPHQALERVQMQATRGTARVDLDDHERLRVVLTLPKGSTGVLDVVATDRETGVSTWLRLE